MRTLICIPCLLTGGTEIQTLNTVYALVQGGHEVTVACYFEHTPEMVERYRKAGAEVILFSPEGIRVGGYRSILFLYRHLRRAIRTLRPDVTHVQYMAPGATVILLLWLMGVKNIIATAHTAADIYKDLRLIHFLQRHCLRAFTCITERAERSFFGSSQLYTPDTPLGKRNHFTIYNALPKATVLQTTDNGQRTTDSHPEENTKLSTLNAKQENSHADCTDYTDSSYVTSDLESEVEERRGFINPQLDGIGLQIRCDEQHDSHTNLDTIAQNTHSFARVSHPEAVSAMSVAPSLRGRAGGEAPFTLGIVSRLEPIKGMDLVVPAFAEVLRAYPETQLLVVGDGTLRASMEQQAVELGCAEAISFVGRQPQEELSQWYGQMDIVLMPSRSEGFGLTAIEAMASGCVVVASDVGGLPEVVRDGICGLLHRTEDITDMVEKISSLIGDKALYGSLQAQSLVEVEKYSFERYAELIQNLYSKIVN